MIYRPLCIVEGESWLQVTRLTELAKAAWATRNREEAVALEQAADEAQKEAILTAKAAETSWTEAQATEGNVNRLTASVNVRSRS